MCKDFFFLNVNVKTIMGMAKVNKPWIQLPDIFFQVTFTPVISLKSVKITILIRARATIMPYVRPYTNIPH